MRRRLGTACDSRVTPLAAYHAPIVPAGSPMRAEDSQLVGLRAQAQPLPLDATARQSWAQQFNDLPGVVHFGLTVDLCDSLLVRVTLPTIADHPIGGLRSRAVNGAALPGL